MKRLLLVGAGHAHLGVLRSLAQQPLAEVEVTLVSPYLRQVYSGMLPGWIAGHYTLDQCSLQIAPLARRAQVQTVTGHVTRLDLSGKYAHVLPGHGQRAVEPLSFDLVSIDTGPVLDLDAIKGTQEHGIALRPIEQFIHIWPRLHVQMAANSLEGGDTSTLTVVGGGAGGVEVALAIAWRAKIAQVPLRVQLVAGRDGILPTASTALRQQVLDVLPQRGVRVIDDDAVEVLRGTVLLAEGGEIASEATILCTGAAAADWPRDSGLGVDGHGFIGVNEYMQSLSHPFVFAAGDCASMIDHPRPKSGVYAVRAGPPLAANLRRALRDEPLQRYVPQARALYLLATGPKHAVASWGPFSTAGEWVWRWKDRIDRRFVESYVALGRSA